MATERAPDEEQGPCSGRSCFEDRAGLAQQRVRGPCRASHEAAACAPAQVKSGPETHAVDVSRSHGRTEARLEMNLDRTGSPGERVCKASMCSRGEPLETQGLLVMRRVTSWLHVWLESGRREIPAGCYHPRRDEVREARTAAMTSRERCASCELLRWCAIEKKERKNSKPRHFE